MPHRRSPSKLAADGRPVLLEGLVCRESNLATALVNKRWLRLYGSSPRGTGTAPEAPVLVSFRHQIDAEPSKMWVVSRGTTVGDIAPGTFRLRENTSTLAAVVASRYTEVQLYSFVIHFSFGGLFAPDTLRLCFDTEAAALEWRFQLTAAIGRLERQGSGASFSIPRSPSEEEVAALAEEPKINGSFKPSKGGGDSTAAAAGAAPPGHAGAGADAARVASSRGGTSASAAARRDESRHAPPPRTWQSMRHVNGVAVYAEEEGPDGEGGALMVSAVVRSSPTECFEVLMAGPGSNSAMFMRGDERVLEVVDKNTQVVMLTFQPGGLVGKLCAPREMVLLRSWRQEPDGTYIVLYQSTNHRRARQAKGSRFSWASPVRANVAAAGFTVSPLLPRYTGGAPSQECLVTLVMKVDLGGWLSQGSLVWRVGRPVTEAMLRAWLEPMLLSVVMLRDKVEQSRFVVRPYSMGEPAEEVLDMPHSTVTHKAVARTTTFLTYSGRRSQDLKDAQRHSLELMLGGGSAKAAAAVARGGAGAAAGLGAGLGGLDEEGSEYLDALSGPASRRTSTDGDEAAAAAVAGADADGASSAAAAAGGALVPSPEEIAAVRAALAAQQQREVPEDERWAVQGTAARRYWSCPGTADLRVRGKGYLVDRKKVPAAMPMFDLYSAELVEVDEPMWHMARFLPSVKYCAAPFMFILQLMVPANPPLSLTMVWTAPLNPMTESLDTLCAAWPEDSQGTVRAFFTNLCEWMKGDGPEADAARNKKFKLIPRIVKGSWIVKQSVGATPVLLGQKLATRYFRGPNYFEVDVDITSNTVANSVTSLVVGAITSLVVDLAPLVEGQAEDELPERLIGSVRFDHLDLKTAAYLDDESGRIYKNERFGHA